MSNFLRKAAFCSAVLGITLGLKAPFWFHYPKASAETEARGPLCLLTTFSGSDSI